MLHSLPAEIIDSKLVWLAAEPTLPFAQRVLVIWDDAPTVAPIPANHPVSPPGIAKGIAVDDLMGRLNWRGSALEQQRTQRDAW